MSFSGTSEYCTQPSVAVGALSPPEVTFGVDRMKTVALRTT